MNTELLMMRFRQSGLNYSELANCTEVSRNTIHNVLFGRTNPSYYVTTRLAEVLDLSNGDIIAIFFPDLTLKRSYRHNEYANEVR